MCFFAVDNSGPRDSHFALSEGKLQCSFGCAIVDPSHDSYFEVISYLQLQDCSNM